MSDFKDYVAQVKNVVLLENIVENYGVSLTPTGYRFKGCCPFHQEKTASFFVDPTTQQYHCFGCGEGGDVIAFVCAMEAQPFAQVLDKLAEENGIEKPSSLLHDENKEKVVDYQAVSRVLKDSANRFYKNFVALDDNSPAKQEILNRGLDIKPLSQGGFLYGYASENKKDLYEYLSSKGHTLENMVLAGVVRQWDNGSVSDVFSGRLMFFIQDNQGKPVGFSGRTVTGDERKYVNSADTPLFNKSRVLFNLSNASTHIRETKEAVVAEGQFDVVAISEAGVKNVVASSGTAFTTTQANILLRMTSRGKIIFCFDGDEAGIKATFKVFTSLPELHPYAVVSSMPHNTDPCDYRKEFGNDALREHIANSGVNIVDYVLGVIAQRYDLNNSAQRSKYAHDCIEEVLVHIQDRLIFKNAVRTVALDSHQEMADVEYEVNNARSIAKNTQRTDKSKENFVPEYLDKNSLHNDSINSHDKDKELMSNIDEYIDYKVFAKMLALAMKTRENLREKILTEDFPEDFLPFKRILESGTQSFFPELFDTPQTASYILSDDFMNVLPTMDMEDIHHHYDYLTQRYHYIIDRSSLEEERKRIYRTLDGGTVNDLKKLYQ